MVAYSSRFGKCGSIGHLLAPLAEHNEVILATMRDYYGEDFLLIFTSPSPLKDFHTTSPGPY